MQSFEIESQTHQTPRFAGGNLFQAAQGVLATYRKRVWNGKHGEVYTYRYVNHLPLRQPFDTLRMAAQGGDKDAMQVNWVELTITHEEVIYRNAFITDFEVKETTIEAIVRHGRARWKVENENNNVLKTKGYHLEHNFGHGNQYLSSLPLSLNLLAFLFHTVLGLVDKKYRLLRQVLRKRQKFFQDMETLSQYILFDTRDDLFSFMCKGLELDTS